MLYICFREVGHNCPIVNRAVGIKLKWSQPCLYDCMYPFFSYILVYLCYSISV